jgi:hypothetical protein
MATTQYAKALPGMRINGVDTGHTATDLNGHNGTETMEQGASVIVPMAKLDATERTGTFVDENGIVPW